MAIRLCCVRTAPTSIGKGDCPEGVEDAKNAVGLGEAIKVVLHVCLLALVPCQTDGNGGVGDGHDGCQQGDHAQLVEVG